MKVSFVALLLLCTCLESFAGPTADTTKNTSRDSVRILSLNGPSGIALARLAADSPVISETRIVTGIVPSVDVLLPQLLNGDAIAGVLPPNVAAKLYNRSPGSIVLCAVIGNGMLSVLSVKADVKSFDDLAGSVLYSTGSGSTPEYLFREIQARRNGRSSDTEIDFSLSPAEVATALVSGKIEHALLPEPFATVALMKASSSNRPVYRAIPASEMSRAAGFSGDYPMTVFVARSEIARNDPELLNGILDRVEKSILWTNENPAEAGRVAERAGLGITAAVTEASIPSCNLVYSPASEARDRIERLLSVFLSRSPESVGGSLPDEGFYLK